MTGTLTYSGAEYPLAGETNSPPADFLRFGTDIDQLLVLKATSTADRNARFANVAAGTLVSCAAESVVWMKTTTPPTAAAWMTLSEDVNATTGVVTSGVNGFTVNTEWGQKRNGMVSVSILLTYGSTDIVGDGTGTASPGNVSDITIGTLTSGWRPPTGWTVAGRSNVANWMTAISTAGVITLTAGVPAGKLRTGDGFWLSATYPKT